MKYLSHTHTRKEKAETSAFGKQRESMMWIESKEKRWEHHCTVPDNWLWTGWNTNWKKPTKKMEFVQTNCRKKRMQNKHNFPTHTIIIYQHYENSMIKKTLKTKIVKNYSHTFRHHKQSASLGCTAPIDHSIKVAQFKYIDTVEEPPLYKSCDMIKLQVPPFEQQITQLKAEYI